MTRVFWGAVDNSAPFSLVHRFSLPSGLLFVLLTKLHYQAETPSKFSIISRLCCPKLVDGSFQRSGSLDNIGAERAKPQVPTWGSSITIINSRALTWESLATSAASLIEPKGKTIPLSVLSAWLGLIVPNQPSNKAVKTQRFQIAPYPYWRARRLLIQDNPWLNTNDPKWFLAAGRACLFAPNPFCWWSRGASSLPQHPTGRLKA